MHNINLEFFVQFPRLLWLLEIITFEYFTSKLNIVSEMVKKVIKNNRKNLIYM